MTAKEAVISIRTQLDTDQSDTDIVNAVATILQRYHNTIYSDIIQKITKATRTISEDGGSDGYSRYEKE